MKRIEPLFFEDTQGKEHVVAEVQTMEDAFKAIRQFCAERDYYIHYTRFYIEDCPAEEGSGTDIAWRITFDVGSWSEFFHIYFDTFKKAEAFRETVEFKKPC